MRISRWARRFSGVAGSRSPEQGCRGANVLVYLGEVWEGFVILDDPPVHVMSHDACMPTVSVALGLSLELCMFLLELESCFFELLVSRPQLLYPQARRGPCIPLDLVVEVVCWGSPSLVDAFDVSLGGRPRQN